METKEEILLKHFAAELPDGSEVAWMETHPTRSKAILAAMEEFATQNKDKVNEVFLWLLGYSDFPLKEIGLPAYYWRPFLREKIKKDVVNYLGIIDGDTSRPIHPIGFYCGKNKGKVFFSWDANLPTITYNEFKSLLS